jgi:hypothetical protein
MLARKMKLKLNGLEVGTTPMLVPAFSSKANIDICKTIETTSESINGPILISAYDVNYAEEFPPITFPDLIFLDSGGYECLRDEDVSEIGFYQLEARPWNRDMHLKVVREWPKDIPTVLVSYDHPLERGPTEKQIEDAKDLFHKTDNIFNEILNFISNPGGLNSYFPVTLFIIWGIAATVTLYSLSVYRPYKKIRDNIKQIEKEFIWMT